MDNGFVTEIAVLELSLQTNRGRIVVIEPDPVLFPDVHTVQLFQKRFVIEVVKIQTSDFISSVYGMTVRLHHRPQSLPQETAPTLSTGRL